MSIEKSNDSIGNRNHNPPTCNIVPQTTTLRVASLRSTNKIISVSDNPEEKRPLGRQRSRWVNNIKIDPTEIGWDGVDWIDLAQDRGALVNTVMNLRVP
jgi:hypothetical protein